MNYMSSMKNLKKYEETRISLRQQLVRAGNVAKNVKDMLKVCDGANEGNVTRIAESLIRSPGNGSGSYFSEYIENGCAALEVEPSDDLKKKTAAYESRVSQIRREAAEEIERGTEKPLSQNAGKIMGLLWSGCAAFVFLILFPIVFQPMLNGPLYEGGSSFSFATIIGIACLLIFISLLTRKKKPDQQKLSGLAAELKKLTHDYVNFASPIFDEAFEKLEADCEAQIEALTAEIKAEIGETVYELYENTPLGQRGYFLDLGMTATCEADFNDIVKECIKAEKTDQQIALQNHLNNEARNEITKSINKLNQTARQIQEDARAHASQMAEQNRQLAQQNERSLKNQSKTLGELKKQTKLSSDLEFQVRQVKDKVDD